MTLATIHGAGAAVATAILSCDLSIDVADKNDCHDGEDDIYDNFLHSCLNWFKFRKCSTSLELKELEELKELKPNVMLLAEYRLLTPERSDNSF